MSDGISPQVRVASDESFRFSQSPRVLFGERVIFDYCMVFVKEGTCEITVNDRRHLCSAGDVYLFRPGVPHSTTIIGKSFRQLHMHFYIREYDIMQYFTPFQPRSSLTQYEPLFLPDDIDEMGVHFPSRFTPSDPEYVEKLFTEVISVFNDVQHSALRELSLKSSMLRLLVYLLRDIELQTQNRISPQLAQMNLVKSYIDAHCTDVTLETLEKEFFLNRCYIVQQFNRFFGISPIKYCTMRRIERSKTLLSYPSQTVGSISESVGYNDVQSFSRAFRRCTGMSPTEFRATLPK